MPLGTKGDQPPGSLRVAFEGVNNGTDWAVIHNFKLTPTLVPAMSDLNAIVDLIADEFCDDFIENSNVSADVVVTLVKAKYALPAQPDALRTVRVADGVGAGPHGGEAGQVCYLINWATSDGRRGGKPRSYIPGVTGAAMLDQARIEPAVIAAMTANANTYHNHVNAIVSAPWTECQFVDTSYVNAGAYRLEPTMYEIFEGSLSPVVATQRRRVDRLRS